MELNHLREIGLPFFDSGSFNGTATSSRAAASTPGFCPPCGPVVTRFAPSPTGFLHIGGARTALFCYMYAKKHGGQFKLRIEDTDAERNDEAAVDAIIKGLDWLGTKHDGEIVRQSRNQARHTEVAKQLLADNKAYKCYCSKEELDAMRAQAEKDKVAFRYPGKCRDVGPDFKPPPGRNPVVRIKTPNDNGTTAWDDGVMGHIEFPNKDIDDFIILRTDGSPTYLLAVVVDDHDMEVSHVMRGADHIPNTPRQIAIYNNCGWDMPKFNHFPLIHGPDGKKMSKRHGATGAEQYEALGYLPEAMRNYLARLSWAHGNDEIFTTEQAIEWFDFDGCSRGAPCFDFDKLASVNQHYIKECDVDRLTDILLKFFPDCKPFEKKLRMPDVANLLKPRAKTVVEYRQAAEFIIAKRPISIIPAVAKKITTDAQKATLRDVADLLKNYAGEWNVESIETLINGYVESTGMKRGEVATPLRVAFTGTNASPGIFEVIWTLGKDECIGRCQDAIDGLCVVKEAEAAITAATVTQSAEEPKAEATKAPVAPPTPAVVPQAGGDLEQQIKTVGEEIRELKAKLKAGGMSGKAIDKTDEVKALVAKLTELKAATATQSTNEAKVDAKAPPAPASVPQATGGDLEQQIKAVGDEIRELKAKLKASGMSGKAIDKTDEVKALVAKLTELKAAA